MGEVAHVTNKHSYFLDPLLNKPPAATKVLLLTKYGICTVGVWGEDCVAWLPLPKVPPSVKERMKHA